MQDPPTSRMDHEAPQVWTPPTDSQKEVYTGHHYGIEVTVPPHGTPQPTTQYGGHQNHYAQDGQMKPEPRIMGMRRTTFFLTVALVLVIVAGAVGGGVGGGLAVKDAETRCIS